eukprot:Cvel_18063.t1-p1 / transcript=Cvel_18063.t1 / gene=Cvel_18063 / organism=Chromera_velia_CCMP2878 / gene_product=hypothetical protein / transcript_product=hypothetical protein / location=Cvel_scaffold1476:44517-45949(+) / protein_length=283 / sequence_SO=supercontig / SO=protein_coding / is_pseudo=false
MQSHDHPAWCTTLRQQRTSNQSHNNNKRPTKYYGVAKSKFSLSGVPLNDLRDRDRDREENSIRERLVDPCSSLAVEETERERIGVYDDFEKVKFLCFDRETDRPLPGTVFRAFASAEAAMDFVLAVCARTRATAVPRFFCASDRTVSEGPYEEEVQSGTTGFSPSSSSPASHLNDFNFGGSHLAGESAPLPESVSPSSFDLENARGGTSLASPSLSSEGPSLAASAGGGGGGGGDGGTSPLGEAVEGEGGREWGRGGGGMEQMRFEMEEEDYRVQVRGGGGGG